MNYLHYRLHVAATAHLLKRIGFSGVFLVVLGSCAYYSGYGLKPGVAKESDIREAMGKPTVTWMTPAGDVWAYPRGPLGAQTFLVYFDKSGTLKAIEPVLDEDHFAQIAAGMTHEQVLHKIGPPFQTITFPNLDQVSWDYHYTDLWGYSAIFSVIFDQAGRVVYTFKQRQFQGGNHQ
ncbi:MAG TPA: hypothetical protein VLV32_02755 [Burkholderiales bacterium]|nr:hypothetical protein [Burkholderiales bacterium]